MKLRAYLTIDGDAEGFLEAAKWEAEIKALAERLASEGYQGVTYEVRERRAERNKEKLPKTRRNAA